MCIGGLAAVSLYRYEFFGRKVLYSLIFILILSPDIVMGISLLILFSLVKISLGFSSLLLAHITFCIPFVVVTVYSRIVSFDQYIFEAAKDLGATDTHNFYACHFATSMACVIGRLAAELYLIIG